MEEPATGRLLTASEVKTLVDMRRSYGASVREEQLAVLLERVARRMEAEIGALREERQALPTAAGAPQGRRTTDTRDAAVTREMNRNGAAARIGDAKRMANRLHETNQLLLAMVTDRTAFVTQVLQNLGIDTRCGACMEVGFTGMTTNRHTCVEPFLTTLPPTERQP
jgi:hypothetical protein